MKKFLSLVLALVMTMSLVTVSAGAKDFTDSDKLSGEVYEEAVNVMSEMGIIDGYSSGDFRPQGTLTRGAAAKIIACMMLGKTTAEALGTQAAPFKDVPAGSTFAGYIAYCVESGLIDGYADGTFRPQGTLTGFAFLKMLLTALGYDSAIEGYTGTNWTVNVASRATQIGLTDGNDEFVGTQAATREEACLYAVNTLKSTLVEYENKGQEITVSDGTVITVRPSAPTYVTSNVYDAATSINDSTDNEKNGWTVEFAEKYQPDLELDATTDDFGRPSHIWTWKNDEIGSYVDYDKMVAEYTTKVTGRDLYDLLGKAALDECDVYTYVDGETTRDVLRSAYFTENNIVRDNKDGVGETGNGVLTQVFHDTVDDVITVAVINTYLAKAAEDYDDKNEDVELDVYAIENVGGRTAAYVKNDSLTAPTAMTVEAEDFDIADVTEDQLFLVTVADGKVQTMADPEILAESTISKFSTGKYVISGGTQYDYADTAKYDPDVLDYYTGIDGTVNLKDLSYNIILDPYGYLIGVELNEDPDQYLFLTGIDLGRSNLSNRNADANVIFLSGEMDTITVNMRKSVDADGDPLSDYTVTSADGTSNSRSQLNTWCTYTVNSDGVYTLKQVNTDGTGKTMQSAQSVNSSNTVVANEKVTIDEKHVTLNGAGSYGKVFGNEETVYLNVEQAKIGDDNSNGSNDVWIIDDVESVTTGIQNVSLTIKELGQQCVASYAYPKNEIYTLYDDDGYAIAVVTIGENEGSTTNYAYIVSDKVGSEEYRGDDDLWVFTREALVNGKLVELTEVGDAVDVLSTTSMSEGNWYKIKYDADGNVRGRDLIEGTHGLSDGDETDGYIDSVADYEKAVEAKDTVLLDTDLAYTADTVYLSLKAGTLYVTHRNAAGVITSKDGFFVSPEVQVALSLASEPDSYLDNIGNAFDDIDDSYTGRDGLEKALRNLDTDGVDLDNDGAIEYLFNGNLAALFENGVATSIVLDDRSGVLATDYNPLKDMVVTVNLVDIDTNRTLGTDTVTVKGNHAVTSKLGATITYPTVNASAYNTILNTRWGVNYQPVPSTDSADLTYREGREYEVTFYYRAQAAVNPMTIEVIYEDASGETIAQEMRQLTPVSGQSFVNVALAPQTDAAIADLANYEVTTKYAENVGYVSGGFDRVVYEVAKKTATLSLTKNGNLSTWSFEDDTLTVTAGDEFEVTVIRGTVGDYSSIYPTYDFDLVGTGVTVVDGPTLADDGSAGTSAKVTFTCVINEIDESGDTFSAEVSAEKI